MPHNISDKDIRQWILSDPNLYNEAREAGKGGDDEMYDNLPNFIDQNRHRLQAYIHRQLHPNR